MQLHMHACSSPCRISKLLSLLDNKSGKPTKSFPAVRMLLQDQAADVELTLENPMCMEVLSLWHQPRPLCSAHERQNDRVRISASYSRRGVERERVRNMIYSGVPGYTFLILCTRVFLLCCMNLLNHVQVFEQNWWGSLCPQASIAQSTVVYHFLYNRRQHYTAACLLHRALLARHQTTLSSIRCQSRLLSAFCHGGLCLLSR